MVGLIKIQKLSDFCLDDGFVIIGTNGVSSEMTCENFKKWWYKEDTTHVSFYSEKSLQKCGERVGLELIKQHDNRFFVMKKIKDFSRKH